MAPRILDLYKNEVVQKLRDEFSYENVHQVPALEKIVVNIGLGEAAANPKLLETAAEELASITGQKAVIRRARKSIANFKLRQGQEIGCSVTLRRTRMWEFFDRLVSVSLPRVRDFKGISPKAFDGRGNFSLGIREQIIFPEIDYDSVKETRGLDVAVTTTAATDEEAFELLLGLGFPFAEEGRPGAGPSEAEQEAERVRKEEARQRAQAEQAALEQLKDENPDAYAKPEPTGEESEEADGDGGDKE
jgi:large subunit ribosomal protein L5